MRLKLILIISIFSVCQISQAQKTGYIPDLNLNNIFVEVVENQTPPTVLDTLETLVTEENVRVTKLHFESVIDSERTNKIFAYHMAPVGKTNLPAILILHGGTQTADSYYKLGLLFAERGYACLIPDLPGITKPENAARDGKGSFGKWAELPYGAHHFYVQPDATACNIYEGVVTAIQAFYLLKSQPEVDAKNIGVRGLSWGGYATTIVSGLLEKQVKAAFAVYGCGFYDLPSWFKPHVEKLNERDRAEWLSKLDAGRYAHKITAPFYYMAASNDKFYWPDGITASFNEIKGKKHVTFSPNDDHSLRNTQADSTEFRYFDYHLKGVGTQLPIVSKIKSKNEQVSFRIKCDEALKEVVLWYSKGNVSWRERQWKAKSIPVSAKGKYKTTLPKEADSWYIIATDKNWVSNGTLIY
jgi:dienelactone hydrolase